VGIGGSLSASIKGFKTLGRMYAGGSGSIGDTAEDSGRQLGAGRGGGKPTSTHTQTHKTNTHSASSQRATEQATREREYPKLVTANSAGGWGSGSEEEGERERQREYESERASSSRSGGGRIAGSVGGESRDGAADLPGDPGEEASVSKIMVVRAHCAARHIHVWGEEWYDEAKKTWRHKCVECSCTASFERL
jgi:hypothetical protein